MHTVILFTLSAFFFYVGVSILNGVVSGWFLLVSSVVLLLNLLLSCAYIRAERETFWWSLEKASVYFKQLEDDIKSVDTIVVFEKTN